MIPKGLSLVLLLLPSVAIAAPREPTVPVQTPRAPSIGAFAEAPPRPLAPSVPSQRPLVETMSHPSTLSDVGPRRAMRAFKTLDSNLDGVLSPRELPNLPQVRANLFAMLDRNGDGRLQAAELPRNMALARSLGMERGAVLDQAAFGRTALPRLIAAADRNGSGGVSAGELRTGLPGEPRARTTEPAVMRAAPVEDRGREDCWIPLPTRDEHDGGLGLVLPVVGSCGLGQ